MKKNYLFLALAAAALGLASCANDDVVRSENGNDEPTTGKAICFKSAANATTRGESTGATAAGLLNNNFVVEGTKGGVIGDKSSVVQTVVFDNYNVNWTGNTAGTTESNTSDWEYVGQDRTSFATAHGINQQTIKFWDYSVGQYDFIAYSLGTGSATPTAITPATATSAPHGGAYTLTGNVDNLSKCYIADLVTVPQTSYDNEVKLTFRNLSSKIRLAFYETVPGYSVRDLEFYESDAATAGTENTNAKLYSSVGSIVKEGTYTVYFPVVNTTRLDATHLSSDLNKAHVQISATSATSIEDLGKAVDCSRAATLEGTEKNYLGQTSKTASYVESTTTKPYTTVLPNEDATALTLRCNYTLVSDDGSKEVIKVWGATAVVPAEYCRWKSNYAYTYIFKISDATNGATEKLGGAVTGIHPITFDAVTVDPLDGNQETITTVETPSITTYAYNATDKKVIKSSENEEYPAATTTDIYVMVQNGTTQMTDLNSNGTLYTVTTTNTKEGISEATVMDALNIQESSTATTITGRNKIVLTKSATTNPTTIPGVDGNAVTVAANSTSKFTATTTATTYAYVYYTGTDNTDSYVYSAQALTTEPGDWSTTLYFTDPDGVNPVDASSFTAGTYYKKYTNNNKVYAVKVIKTN